MLLISLRTDGPTDTWTHESYNERPREGAKMSEIEKGGRRSEDTDSSTRDGDMPGT